MNVLPDRSYNPRTDYRDRRIFLPYGQTDHPAKMYCALLSDLVKMYSKRGDTILDPCFGVGTTALALLHGRNVVGIELEHHHYENAKRNAEHLAALAADLGSAATYSVWEGDSREVIPALGPARPYLDNVTLSPAYADAMTGGDPAKQVARIQEKYAKGELNTENPGGVGRRGRWGVGLVPERATTHGYDVQAVVTSSPFGEMNAEHAGGTVKQRPSKDGKGFEGDKDHFTYSKAAATVTSPAYGDALSGQGGRQRALEQGVNIDKYGMTDGAGYSVVPVTPVDANVLSPTYADVASRDRHLEPYAQGLSPERKAALGQDSVSRNVSGYGKNEAQIGNKKLTDGSYQEAMTQIYAACLDATRDGGLLVTVTGNYIRNKELVDLAELTIGLCKVAGWTPLERWKALKRSKAGTPNVSFWRRSQADAGAPLIDSEDVLVFAKGTP